MLFYSIFVANEKIEKVMVMKFFEQRVIGLDNGHGLSICAAVGRFFDHPGQQGEHGCFGLAASSWGQDQRVLPVRAAVPSSWNTFRYRSSNLWKWRSLSDTTTKMAANPRFWGPSRRGET